MKQHSLNVLILHLVIHQLWQCESYSFNIHQNILIKFRVMHVMVCIINFACSQLNEMMKLSLRRGLGSLS